MVSEVGEGRVQPHNKQRLLVRPVIFFFPLRLKFGYFGSFFFLTLLVNFASEVILLYFKLLSVCAYGLDEGERLPG